MTDRTYHLVFDKYDGLRFGIPPGTDVEKALVAYGKLFYPDTEPCVFFEEEFDSFHFGHKSYNSAVLRTVPLVDRATNPTDTLWAVFDQEQVIRFVTSADPDTVYNQIGAYTELFGTPGGGLVGQGQILRYYKYFEEGSMRHFMRAVRVPLLRC